MATTATEARCTRCGRGLRNASPDGYGPKCRRRVRKAARSTELGQYKTHLVEKAEELLEQGGMVPLRDTGKNAVYLAVSSDGLEVYRTARAACTCPAGLRATYMCAHRIAAHVLALAS